MGVPDVRKMYQDLVLAGRSPKDAAKEVQGRTGYSVVTGRPIKQHGPKIKTKRDWTYGEY